MKKVAADAEKERMKTLSKQEQKRMLNDKKAAAKVKKDTSDIAKVAKQAAIWMFAKGEFHINWCGNFAVKFLPFGSCKPFFPIPSSFSKL